MVTWVQRFGSAANLNVHLHSLATEGVWVEGKQTANWHTLAPPTSEEVAAIAWDVCRRVTKRLQRRGEHAGLTGDDGDVFAEREPLLSACYSASIRGFAATGRRAGQPIMRFGVAQAQGDGDRAPAHGFNLHAGRCIGALDRERREHAIRYMARPPLPDRRLSFTPDGDINLELKIPWRDGTTHIRLTGTELIERLVSLVPRPRVNLIRYHGAFAPNARIRSQVVRRCDSPGGSASKSRRYYDWAQLMTRVFEVDVTQCPRCGTSGMQAIAVITDGRVIRKILAHIGEAVAPPRPEPAQTTSLEWDPAA